MHIAVIVTLKKGLEHFIYRELSILSAQGCRISLFPTKFGQGLYGPKPDWTLCRWSIIAVIAFQPIAFLRSPRKYVRLLSDALRYRALSEFALAWYFASNIRATDVIYATFGDRKLYVGYFCKQITGKALAVSIHAYELYLNPNPDFFPVALAACDQIITVTEYNKELLVRRYQIAPSRIAVVRISVDVEDYRPERKFTVLIVGFFVERKGHQVLFQALKQLEMDDLEVWVVGDEGAEPSVDVRAMAARLGVQSKVAFFGNLNGTALKAAFRSSDVFCLPCHQDSKGLAEGFPTVLAEAMAFGKPIITTRHVEIPRVVSEILVDERDPYSLAQAIRTLYDSPALRAELGRRNREIAEQLFSTENTVKTATLLASIVDGPKHGASQVQASALMPQIENRTDRVLQSQE
jgi:colanic acid/amylovoran biosynthesis glycosyltransferase